MKFYFFEYRNYRGHIVGWSDDIEWTDYKDASERAYRLCAHSWEIDTVIARDAQTNEELGRWGM